MEQFSIDNSGQVVVLISADAEWRAVRQIITNDRVERSPFGEWFVHHVCFGETLRPVLFFQGGWGKISAAASTQYAIDRWQPELLVNLGTCGGLRGRIERGEIVLVERTLVYDIYEQMGDAADHIAHYATNIDLSWLEEDYPQDVRRGLMVSGDRDLMPGEVAQLQERYGALAGDWESAAIAWVAGRSQVRCLILRGVTDLVDASGGEVYGDLSAFHAAAQHMMRRLLDMLPAWLAASGLF